MVTNSNLVVIQLLNDVGLGHCKRMLIYAKKLMSKGKSIKFLINENREDQISCLSKSNVHFIKYNENMSFQKQFDLAFNETFINDINWVIDTKFDCSEWLLFLSNNNMNITLFDNQTDARFIADQNIYPSPLFDKNDLSWESYKGIISGGWEEILLSETILKLNKKIEKENYILFTFGGTDPNEITLQVMNACIDILDKIPIKIIIGPGFRHKDKIIQLNKELGNHFQLIENCDDISTFIAKAKCIITAVGVTIFEAYYVGVPCIVISNYQSDKQDEIKLKEWDNIQILGYFKSINSNEIINALDKYAVVR